MKRAKFIVPDYEMVSKGQCFPLYWYEEVENKSKVQHDFISKIDYCDGYIRRDAITDWALDAFRKHYHDNAITKEDIFWYVYGMLHSPEYKKSFSANLRKVLPNIPFVKEFYAYSSAGKKLGDLHLNYEAIDPYPLYEEIISPDKNYTVSKIVFGKKDGKLDKSFIIYNQFIILREIPLVAYEYVVNGKSAIEWIMEKYRNDFDKESQIMNDPNSWSNNNPRYIIDLIKRVVQVSVETMKVIKNLPPLGEL